MNRKMKDMIVICTSIVAVICISMTVILIWTQNTTKSSYADELQNDSIYDMECNDVMLDDVIVQDSSESEEYVSGEQPVTEETEISEEPSAEHTTEDVIYEEHIAEETSAPNNYTTRDLSTFKRDGVWYDDNYRYTYYSSNVLHHYMTDQWTPDEYGIYRDSEGYAVVASSDLEYGTVVYDTPFGNCKVYDSGCASGTLDVYVNF